MTAYPKNRKSFDDIRSLADRHDGIIGVKMGTLRDATWKKKLGPHVRKSISKSLDARGMAHFPVSLPAHQTGYVTLFVRDSLVGRIVQALADPSPASVRYLRKLKE